MTGAGALAALLGLAEQLLQTGTVGQAGQRVVPGGVLQVLFGGLVLADVALRAGQTLSATFVEADHTAQQNPQVMSLAVADAVLVLQRGAVAAQVLLHRQTQARQVFGVDAGEPAGTALAQLVAGQAEHAGPAFGQVQLVAVDVPVPDAVVGAAQGAGIACVAAFQCLTLGGAVGIHGQAHVEEHGLEQAGEQLVLGMAIEQAGEHPVEVQAVGAQIPLQVQTDTFVYPAHAQPLADVVGIVRSAPQALVIGFLAGLEAGQHAGLLEQAGRGGKTAEVVVQLVDEVLMGMVEAVGSLLQACAVGFAPLQEVQACQHLLAIQADAAQQRFNVFGAAHPVPRTFLRAIKKR